MASGPAREGYVMATMRSIGRRARAAISGGTRTSCFRSLSVGDWPDLISPDRRNEYSLSEIKLWLGVFLERFFKTSQFKRSAIPNGPKVGSGGSLSPRGDWRASSDASARVWLEELREHVPDV